MPKLECAGTWLGQEDGGPGFVILNFNFTIPPPFSVGFIGISPYTGTEYMVYLSQVRIEVHSPQGGNYHIRVSFGQTAEWCADVDVRIPPKKVKDVADVA